LKRGNRWIGIEIWTRTEICVINAKSNHKSESCFESATDEVSGRACRFAIGPCLGDASGKRVIRKPLHDSESFDSNTHNRPTTVRQLFGLDDANERARIAAMVSPSHFATSINKD
jgi:hypothetical protein